MDACMIGKEWVMGLSVGCDGEKKGKKKGKKG